MFLNRQNVKNRLSRVCGMEIPLLYAAESMPWFVADTFVCAYRREASARV